jgi:hypothetical protein
MDGLRIAITQVPFGETQILHKHLMLKEALLLLSGEVEVYSNGIWSSLEEKQIAEFEVNEYHALRTPKTGDPLDFPDVGVNVAAIIVAYKWLPPYFEVTEEEAQIVLANDWFSKEYDTKPTDRNTSPVVRLEEQVRRRFWKIIERNRLYSGFH